MKKGNIKAVITANTSCANFLIYLKEKYNFTDEEIKSIDHVKDHLINMNIVFGKVK